MFSFKLYYEFTFNNQKSDAINQWLQKHAESDTEEDQSAIPSDTSFLYTLCEDLAEHPQVKFEVGGFGDSRWPTDSVDLMVFLEQFQGLVEWVSGSTDQHFALDFYEQGVQRFLLFNKSLTGITIVCRSDTQWVPSPRLETSSRDEIIPMCKSLLINLFILTNIFSPALTDDPLFRAWVRRIWQHF